MQLEVDLRVTPKDVMAFYADVRNEMLRHHEGPRPRAITQGHAELAVFAEEVNDSRTWAEAMAEWNSRHEDWQYDEHRHFGRDCRKAYLRVTGEPLGWRGSARPTPPTSRARRGATG